MLKAVGEKARVLERRERGQPREVDVESEAIFRNWPEHSISFFACLRSTFHRLPQMHAMCGHCSNAPVVVRSLAGQ